MNRVPPSPKGRFLVGSATDFANDALDFMLRVRQYGDIASIKFGPFRIYVLNHPDLIHQVLVTDAAKIRKSSLLKRAAGPAANQGLVTSEGDLWKRQRKLMQPAFHSKSIRAYAESAVDYTLRFIVDWQPGQVYPIEQVMSNLTMHIIVKELFGVDMGPEAKEAGDLVLKLLSLTNDRISQPVPIPDWVPTPGNRAFFGAVDKLSVLIQGYIDQRRQSGVETNDLLSMLLAARDADNGATMDDNQVRHELLTMFGAGYDTTAVALMWAWYLIAANPDVEATFHEEIDTVLNGRLPTFDDLSKLVYTEQILKETMRLYPPAFMMSRQLAEEVQIGGYTFKPGSVFFVNIYGVQRDARFFPDPDHFDPERFSAENEKNIPKYAYLAFGGGARICIGSALALMNAKLILATLGSRYTLSVAPGQIVEPKQVFALHERYGMKMVAHARTPQPA
ncbi:MAG: cytochrome P450 [Chloroflexota bacterium]|nr:cytochrome P450 [Chloroflexota bacterium]